MSEKILIKKMEPDYFKIYKEELEPRIDWLKSNKKYLEILFFLSVLVEEEMDNLINLYDEWVISLLKNNGVNFTPPRYNKKQSSTGMTLGQQVNYLKIYIKNKALIKKIESFIKLRNRVTHKLLRNNIKSLEDEIYKNINSFYALLVSLVEEELKIGKKINSSLKRRLKRRGSENIK